MSDEQDVAESVDEDMVGADAVTSDEVGAFDDAPDGPVGLPLPTPTSPTSRLPSDRPAGAGTVDDPDGALRLDEPASSSTVTSSSASTRTATSPNPTDGARIGTIR